MIEMDHNPFAPDFNHLPQTLPIFPLGGVLLLPCGHLPLNIFEKRYLAMVDDALAGDRLIGMVQPRDANADIVSDKAPVFKTGCAGKITEFSETTDGRYLIKLSGICRFDIVEEIAGSGGYRKIKPNWLEYRDDLNHNTAISIDRDRLLVLLQKYFKDEGMTCDWKAIDNSPDGKLITCLSMVCPFDASEKQALLEAKCSNTRAKMFMTMLEMAVCGGKDCKSQH